MRRQSAPHDFVVIATSMILVLVLVELMLFA
jgi:hypothetical protein